MPRIESQMGVICMRGEGIGRRTFIAVLGGAAVWPLRAPAQQAERVMRIGVLMASAESNREGQTYTAAFREALQKLGWEEGRNIRIDYRWAATDLETIRRSVIELVALHPDSILSANTPTTAALLQQTRTIPIIFATVSDPTGSGFIDSFSRPGGNVTGFTTLEGSLGGKWLELLKEIAPRISRAAFLFSPGTSPFEHFLNPFKVAAESLCVEAIEAPVNDRAELEAVVAALAREPNTGFVVMPGPFPLAHREAIISLAAGYHLPAVYPYRFFSNLGGLLSYGNDIADNYRRAASYVDRILKGTKPSELAIQAPVKFELVINFRTAKGLGLDVPLQLQQIADEVIE
jgi:putative ABC transport system substrate-binding protein